MHVRRNPFDEPTPSAPLNLVAMWQEIARLRAARRRRRTEAAVLLVAFSLTMLLLMLTDPAAPIPLVQIGEPIIVNIIVCPQSEADP